MIHWVVACFWLFMAVASVRIVHGPEKWLCVSMFSLASLASVVRATRRLD